MLIQILIIIMSLLFFILASGAAFSAFALNKFLPSGFFILCSFLCFWFSASFFFMWLVAIYRMVS